MYKTATQVNLPRNAETLHSRYLQQGRAQFMPPRPPCPELPYVKFCQMHVPHSQKHVLNPYSLCLVKPPKHQILHTITYKKGTMTFARIVFRHYQDTVDAYLYNISIQVEPGKPGAEVSKKKNYKSKKEFAYRMCTG